MANRHLETAASALDEGKEAAAYEWLRRAWEECPTTELAALIAELLNEARRRA